MSADALVAAVGLWDCVVQHPAGMWPGQTFYFYFSNLGSDKILLYCGFRVQSPSYTRIEHLFTWVLAIGVSFSVQFRVSVPFAQCFIVVCIFLTDF